MNGVIGKIATDACYQMPLSNPFPALHEEKHILYM